MKHHGIGTDALLVENKYVSSASYGTHACLPLPRALDMRPHLPTPLSLAHAGWRALHPDG
jgi:hypothetical protein